MKPKNRFNDLLLIRRSRSGSEGQHCAEARGERFLNEKGSFGVAVWPMTLSSESFGQVNWDDNTKEFCFTYSRPVKGELLVNR